MKSAELELERPACSGGGERRERPAAREDPTSCSRRGQAEFFIRDCLHHILDSHIGLQIDIETGLKGKKVFIMSDDSGE